VKLSLLGLALLIVAIPFPAFPGKLDDAFVALKDAESRKDAPAVKQFATEAYAAAVEVIKAPVPQSEDAKKEHADTVAFAKDVTVRAEYALLALAVESPAETQIDLFTTLETLNPKSKYLDEAYPRYFQALTQTGAKDKIIPVAEKALVSLPENEDLLLILLENATSQKQNDKALGYANRLVTVMSKHAKPENIPQSDWDKKKSGCLSRGYWTAGVIYGERNQYVNADSKLRSALPYIQGNDAMLAPALFYLGIANYQLGKMTNSKAKVLEGASFSEKAAAIAGPLQEQAYKNARIMKTEGSAMR
jgi:hypothetical protein